MAKKKRRLDPFAELTWDDLDQWAGGRIVSRGRSYQQQGRVSDLARTGDGGLIGWVSGTRRYATKVIVDEDGLLDSFCSCPYQSDCKHGVAVILEYLAQTEKNQRIPEASGGDERLVLLEDEGSDELLDEDDRQLPEPIKEKIEPFLKGKSKAELVELLLDLAEWHPDVARDLGDRMQITSGKPNVLTTRLRREIREIAERPGWQDYWHDEDNTPDYSGIRSRLDALLKAGHADEVLTLGRELVIAGIRQVEESHDEGETLDEVAACMPVMVEALKQSSLAPAAKLAWAVDVVLKDQYGVLTSVEEYLGRRHPKAAWHTLADQLLTQLKALKPAKGTDDFTQGYARDRLSDWAIFALERAGRDDEIIPLCQAEAPRTNSYNRLVKWLISGRRYEDAEHWIHEGIRATKGKWPGIADQLREQLKEIHAERRDMPSVAAMEVEQFVRYPSQKSFTDCEKAGRKIKVWPQVREHLLTYLEQGVAPWSQKGWPLPLGGPDAPEPSARESFPMVGMLIDIAIHEKDPERVLRWYDRLSEKRFRGPGIDEGRIASAVEVYAPDRAVAIWKNQAEKLIAQTSPRAYEEAGGCLRKAGAVMGREGKEKAWAQYLQDLRETHARKRRFIEILDRLGGKPIVAGKRRGAGSR